MTSKHRTGAVATLVIAALAGGRVGAADAATSERFQSVDGPFTNVYEPCGAVETVTISVHGREFFDADGNSLRIRAHYAYDSEVVGPGGRSISLDAHQSALFTPEGINVLTGQGANVRAPGMGLLYQDVGRLVFDDTGPFPGETLFTSAKAVSFEAFDPDKLAAAICLAVG